MLKPTWGGARVRGARWQECGWRRPHCGRLRECESYEIVSVRARMAEPPTHSIRRKHGARPNFLWDETDGRWLWAGRLGGGWK
jgi:hypothetical protein